MASGFTGVMSKRIASAAALSLVTILTASCTAAATVTATSTTTATVPGTTVTVASLTSSCAAPSLVTRVKITRVVPPPGGPAPLPAEVLTSSVPGVADEITTSLCRYLQSRYRVTGSCFAYGGLYYTFELWQTESPILVSRHFLPNICFDPPLREMWSSVNRLLKIPATTLKSAGLN
jgi:hypothetical protein